MDTIKEPFKLSELSALIDSCLKDASDGKDEKINTFQLEKVIITYSISNSEIEMCGNRSTILISVQQRQEEILSHAV